MHSMPYYGYRGIDLAIEIKSWCKQQFGAPVPVPHACNFDQGGNWFTTPGKIHFLREKDAILYALRWL
jgi:hypothetical protein